MADIEWRSLPGFSQYEVSEYGDVRRTCGHYENNVLVYPKGLQLKPWVSNGYKVFDISHDTKGSTRIPAHRLVCTAWHGQPSGKKKNALHRDDVKTNNHYSNLYWGSHQDNREDAVRNGRVPPDEDFAYKVPHAKYTKEDIQQIRKEYASTRRTCGCGQLAKKWGCSREVMKDIINNRAYKDPTYTKHSKW